jgi:hypothetical protein
METMYPMGWWNLSRNLVKISTQRRKGETERRTMAFDASLFWLSDMDDTEPGFCSHFHTTRPPLSSADARSGEASITA